MRTRPSTRSGVVNLSLTPAWRSRTTTSRWMRPARSLCSRDRGRGQRRQQCTATLFRGNDPSIITVGATDDKGTASLADDAVAAFSAYGITESGFAQPDLVTPAEHHRLHAGQQGLDHQQQHAANKVDDNYFKMSGTSMAGPMVSGAVACSSRTSRTLTPNQVSIA